MTFRSKAHTHRPFFVVFAGQNFIRSGIYPDHLLFYYNRPEPVRVSQRSRLTEDETMCLCRLLIGVAISGNLKRYYKKGLNPKNYGVDGIEELAGLVRDTVVLICPPKAQKLHFFFLVWGRFLYGSGKESPETWPMAALLWRSWNQCWPLSSKATPGTWHTMCSTHGEAGVVCSFEFS